MTKLLFRFTHGLGDAVQFTCVLKHLDRHRPDLQIDVAALIGKHSCFHGLCNAVHVLDRDPIDESQYNDVRWVGWYENYSENKNSPYTKVCNYLREEWGIEPAEELLRYTIQVSEEKRRRAAEYMAKITNHDTAPFPAVAIHYEGNTSADKKNLSHDQAQAICGAVLERGYVPIILDWDRRSPLPDQQAIFCPDVHDGDLWGGTGTGDAEMLAALIGQCEMMIGVDSGPLHVAGATETPTLGIWKGHHPIQFYDLCPNVVHLVPESWGELYPSNVKPEASLYFTTKYKWDTYSHLSTAIRTCIEEPLPMRKPSGCEDLIERCGFWVRRENVAQDMVIVRDIYQQDAYKMRIIRERVRDATFVVDVGAHIGTFAWLIHEMNPNCKIICVEACAENLGALRKNVGDFATIIHAACTYEKGELMLHNAYAPNCRSTGGSTIMPAGAGLDDAQYHLSPVSNRTTLEQLMWPWCRDYIDILKLDCEGSEFSILENTPSLRKIGFIVGEYHDRRRWDHLRRARFQGWDYGIMSEAGDLGNFHLRNPAPLVQSVPQV